LSVLKNEWSPALTMRTMLLSLQALLSTPNADDPQDGVVAGVFKNDHAKFVVTAKQWTTLCTFLMHRHCRFFFFFFVRRCSVFGVVY
jgi:ubiquitin-conjugating enzyme (huntingtin interacting protein 2)